MNYTNLRKCIANYGDKTWTSNTYAIWNEFGTIAIVYADHEQDAFDETVDRGYLNSNIMSPEDHAEYCANGWHDSFTYMGNAGEAVWTENLGITKLNSTPR